VNYGFVKKGVGCALEDSGREVQIRNYGHDHGMRCMAEFKGFGMEIFARICGE